MGRDAQHAVESACARRPRSGAIAPLGGHGVVDAYSRKKKAGGRAGGGRWPSFRVLSTIGRRAILERSSRICRHAS